MALASTDKGGPAGTDEEEPNAADDAGALSTTPAIAATTTPAPSAGAVGEDSSLAEDILAAPSTLPANDTVRVEAAAYLRKNMLDGTRPPPRVLELVLPGSRKPVSGPSDKQMAEKWEEYHRRSKMSMLLLNACRTPQHLPRLSNNSPVARTAAVPLRLTNLTQPL